MSEASAYFHFATPAWLWALLVLIPVAFWLAVTASYSDNPRVKRYADSHLLPHLMGIRQLSVLGKWRRFSFWALLWSLIVLALAGPRWGYTDVQLFRPNSNLVVLLDISRSMDVDDVRPTRLSRARQELEDLLNQSQGLRVGLIAFASVAHVISPVTEDYRAIQRVLPALSTDLVNLKGSRLTSALERAAQLFAGQPEDSTHALLLISDGDFVEMGLEERIRRLASDGIRTHVLGIGTSEGGLVVDSNGRPLYDRTGKPVRSRLNESVLRSIADAGQGEYQLADFRDSDTDRILSEAVVQDSVQKVRDERTRVWNEHFYWLVGLVMLLLLPRYRRIRIYIGSKRERVKQW